MASLPLLKPNLVVNTLEKFGWEVARSRGSHIILTKAGHNATLSIPNHREVARGTLRSILNRAGITVDEFIETLEK
jgi:predicted RNA binding protein YcfA (HicA-like mRNA interferase family)